jgi:heptosyltransferase III
MNTPRQVPFSLDIPQDSRDRLVVAHQGALGDLLLSLPLFDGLARVSTHRRIDFWGRPELLTLLATKAYLGRIGSCDSSELTAFFHDELWRQAQVPVLFQGATALFIIGQEQSRILAERLRHHLTAPVIWIQSFPRDGPPIPVATYLVDQVRAAGWPIEHSLPHLVPRDDEVRSVRAWIHREGWTPARAPVLIHPGSGGFGKIWPLQRWWHLIQWLLNEAGVPVLVLVGPADQIARPLAISATTMGARAITDVSLPRLAAIISCCRLFIGNDSGVTHLAAALGVPTVAIFGPTNPDLWAPRGPHVQVIQSHWRPSETPTLQPTISPVSVEASVLTAVELGLSALSQI